MSASIDVLIAGAGPAGSATAAHLARRGYRVVVVDRAVFPRDKACSEYLGPEALRLLDQLGVVGDLEQAGAQPLLGTTVVAPRGASLTGLFSRTAVRPYRDAGLSVARRILDQALVDVARRAGAEVRERLTAEELLYESGAVAGLVVRDATGGRQHSPRAAHDWGRWTALPGREADRSASLWLPGSAGLRGACSQRPRARRNCRDARG